MVGYASGATMNRDRLFDAVTNKTSTKLYSLINEESFIIQGRATPFEVTDRIPLGVNINTAGSYYIAISHLDGLFVTDNQTVYLKDNYTNITFNLSEDPYSFTSETGEFNDRFEIVFQTQSLSIDENIINSNQLTVIELSDGSTKFKVNEAFSIKQLEILDLLGRKIYSIIGSSYEEIYFLPQLQQSAYIVKATLSNDQVLTKKVVKR